MTMMVKTKNGEFVCSLTKSERTALFWDITDMFIRRDGNGFVMEHQTWLENRHITLTQYKNWLKKMLKEGKLIGVTNEFSKIRYSYPKNRVRPTLKDFGVSIKLRGLWDFDVMVTE